MKRTTHPILLVLIALVAAGCNKSIIRPIEDLRVYAGVNTGDQRLYTSETDTITLVINDVSGSIDEKRYCTYLRTTGVAHGFPNGETMTVYADYTFRDVKGKGAFFDYCLDASLTMCMDNGKLFHNNYIEYRYNMPEHFAILSEDGEKVIAIHQSNVGYTTLVDPAGRSWNYIGNTENTPANTRQRK